MRTLLSVRLSRCRVLRWVLCVSLWAIFSPSIHYPKWSFFSCTPAKIWQKLWQRLRMCCRTRTKIGRNAWSMWVKINFALKLVTKMLRFSLFFSAPFPVAIGEVCGDRWWSRRRRLLPVAALFGNPGAIRHFGSSIGGRQRILYYSGVSFRAFLELRLVTN